MVKIDYFKFIQKAIILICIFVGTTIVLNKSLTSSYAPSSTHELNVVTQVKESFN